MDNLKMNYEILGRFWRDPTFPDKTLKAMIWHPIFSSVKIGHSNLKNFLVFKILIPQHGTF